MHATIMHTMARKIQEVVAHLPRTIELSKRGTQNELKLDIWIGEKAGTLYLARGAVEWWPKFKSTNARRGNWATFLDILEEHLPHKRGKRRRKR